MTAPFQAMRGLSNIPWFSTLRSLDPFTSGSSFTTVTASATPHTKGAWTQLVASTAAETAIIALTVTDIQAVATETSTLIDVATGAAGSEVAIAENIAVGGAAVPGTGVARIFLGCVLPLPIRVSAGTRLSVRIQGVVASQQCRVVHALLTLPGRQTLPTSVDVLGTSTANSRGTALSGASGSWTEITASTARRYRALYAVPSVIGTDILSVAVALETGVGAAGSEVVLGRQLVQFLSSEGVGNFANVGMNLPFACDVAAGSRLAVRHDIAANPGRYGVCLIGVP